MSRARVSGEVGAEGKQIMWGPQVHSGPPQGGHHGRKRGTGESCSSCWAVLCQVLCCGLGHLTGGETPLSSSWDKQTEAPGKGGRRSNSC